MSNKLLHIYCMEIFEMRSQIYVTHHGDKERNFTIDGLTQEPADGLRFINQDNKEMTIT